MPACSGNSTGERFEPPLSSARCRGPLQPFLPNLKELSMYPVAEAPRSEPNLLLDLSSIKSGGGAQLALNFLQAVNAGRFRLPIGLVLVSDSFPFHDRLVGPYAVALAPSGAHARLFHEHWEVRKLVRKHRITHVYTFFGPGLPRMQGVRRVVGMAYPTLVYDDAPYWKYLPVGFRLRKRLQNALRVRRLQSADHLIFETEIMERRARSQGIVRNGASVLRPTPTAFLASSQAPSITKHGAQILFLSGPEPHKNIWRLPGILAELQRENLQVRFLLSMDRKTFLAACPSASAIPVKTLDSYFTFLGGLSADGLQAAYDSCNVVGNLSDLESFSNNYMEAWVVGRPILASNRDFARHVCGESALYVEPHDPDSLIAGLRRFARGEVHLEAMVEAGREALARLPSMEERLKVLAEIIAPCATMGQSKLLAETCPLPDPAT